MVCPTENDGDYYSCCRNSTTQPHQSPPDASAAYAFALVGNGTVQRSQLLSHLTAIELLLRTRPVYDVLSLQTSEYASHPFVRDQIDRLGVHRQIIPMVPKPRCKHATGWVGHLMPTYSLLVGLWNVTLYRKILYLDSDVAVLYSLDAALSSFLHSSAVELRTALGCQSHPTPGKFNTGVWGISPSRRYVRILLERLRGGDFECGVGFQTLAGTEFRQNCYDVLPTSSRLNVLSTRFDDTVPSASLVPYRIRPLLLTPERSLSSFEARGGIRSSPQAAPKLIVSHLQPPGPPST